MAQPGRETEGRAHARLTRVLLFAPWVAVLVTLSLQVLTPAFTERVMFYPLLLGVVFLGLPHGALDHLIPTRMGLPWARRPLGITVYLLAYLALAGATFALWLLKPLVAFVAFLLATVWHWGQGDARFWEIFLDRARGSRWDVWTTFLVRGGLPVLLPVLAFPETAESFYRHAAWGLGMPPRPLDLRTPWLVGPLAALLCFGLVAYAVNARKVARNRRALLGDGAEVLLLLALFGFVPAYLAIGVYFLFWHSLRHLGRLLLLAPESARAVRGNLRQPAVRLARDLVPITLAALLLLGGLYLLYAPFVGSLEGFVALYLVLVSALTKPHLVVVALMDVWDPLPSSRTRPPASRRHPF